MKECNYDLLWQPIKINKMILRNRIIMSPMGTFTPMPYGMDREEGLRYYEERAKGGAAMICTGATFISTALAQGSPSTHVDDINAVPYTTTMVERIHRWGAKACLQLSPGTGRNSVLGDLFKEAPISASPNPAYYDPSVICREMTKEEIAESMEKWVFACRFALMCGFDCIQIHAHAGYLIDQFLSSNWNRRTDEYGGSFENRCRFLKEIVEKIRSVVGPDFPVTLRIALDHRIPGGRTIEESMKILDVLDTFAIDAFDIDAGCYETQDFVFPTRYNGDACMAYVCEEARKHLTKPIINAGSHTMETAAELIASGNADIIQFGRQLIADPQFPNKLREGRREDIRPCILCNEECIGRIFGRCSQLSCTVNPATGLETHMEVKPVSKPTNVVVIGGGPGGMEAARCAAERGCSVTLFEKGSELGGTFRTIATGSFKHRMRDLVDWYKLQLEKLGVKIVLNTEVKVGDAALAEADRIFVATGSKPLLPPIPGIEKAIDVENIHKNGMPDGKNVVICGGGLSACDTAIECGEKHENRNITIVEMQPQIGADVMPINAISINRLIGEYGIKTLVNTKVVGITDSGVEVESAEGRKTIPADVVIGAFGRRANVEKAFDIEKAYPTKTTIIGDCVKPAKAGSAIRDGFYAAMSIL